MLITVNLQNKDEYIYKTFKRMWNEYKIECQICFDLIENDGVIAVTEYRTLNLEKMFHQSCLKRWQRERNRDPFNRNVKFWFDFPPKSLEQCSALLEHMKGFIGDQQPDKDYADEYNRIVKEDSVIDIELDFEKLLSYTRPSTRKLGNCKRF
uniref:Ac53 n=1 Tax=Trichoplusia ni single nucleopolyhedrovirus TaxID=332054 RepID=A0A481V8S3_9ABAC|nr:hypothetical protein [Trichoplusia ni single nucleopolyhedrovirus]